MDWTNLTEVLRWIEGIGAPIVVGYIFALVAENFDFWHKLPSKVKFVLPMVFSVLISVVAHFVLAEEQFIISASPYFQIIANAVLIYLGSQNGYMQALKSGYTSSDKLEKFLAETYSGEEEIE